MLSDVQTTYGVKMDKGLTKIVQVRFSSNDLDHLKSLCVREGVPLSTLIRMAALQRIAADRMLGNLSILRKKS